MEKLNILDSGVKVKERSHLDEQLILTSRIQEQEAKEDSLKEAVGVDEIK